ncbi:hypothetical protein [Solicola gregarius]|uniref:Prevent-host-death family protein n=1 Tax=Solicola gregarius TaxID=2908642 RepID=A0AA46YJ95_9ACTN|nr:hypothetical protein [Solicola gregarius]UYM04092.1 hypothetical protein L0C25_16285 [Solicola gregarius]
MSTATLSELLRNPNDVIDRLNEGDVVLTRRGGEALRLSKDQDASQEREMVGALAHLIGATLLDKDVVERLAGSLQESFPWMEFLDAPARQRFVDDFLRTARACASVGRFDRLGVEVANWRETAIAYSLGLQSRPDNLEYLPEGSVVPDPRAS